jgi:flagellar basal-body rod modification protein FlgD
MTTSNVSSNSSYYQSLINSVNGASSSTTSSTSSAASDAQDRFLKLLTTQLQNQDPLNPLDNAQMTSQLAQISTVSGIEKLNATLQTLLQSNQDAQSTQAAGLVGHSVLVPGSALALSNSTAVGGVDLSSAANKVTVTITDANGLAVRTLSLGTLDAGVHDFVWDGKTDSGAQATDGSYTVSVAASQGANAVTASSLSLGMVRSVIRDSNGMMVDVGSLGTVTLDNVMQIL